MALAKGTATITATAQEGFTSQCALTVSDEVIQTEAWDSATKVALWEGDSLTSFEDGRSFAGNMQLASGSKMRFSAHNGQAGTDGTGGHKLQDVLSEVQRNLTENPKMTDIFIHCGTNNYMDTSAADALSLATQIIDAYNAGGVRVHWLQILPRVVLQSGAPAKFRLAFNYGLANMKGKNLHVFNGDKWYDPTDTTVSEDGTHQTSKGGRLLMAGVTGAYFTFPATTWTDLLPVNRMVNQALSSASGNGTVTNGTGAVCRNYVVDNQSGATMVVTMVVENGVNVIQVDITGSATSAGLVTIYQNNTNLKALAGQAVEGGTQIAMSGTASADPKGLQAWALADIKTGGGRLFHDQTLDTHGAVPAYSGPARILPKILTTDATAAKLGLSVRLAVGAVDVRLKYYPPRFGIYELDV
ncbi:putative minor capsid protein [Pseudomonas phage MR1]|uniref:Putative minor capsid protein n=1 Tax=Pseudomonas phage MR1 TaxID=2711169 RepID=A0A6M3T8Q2_9CAUD|nr:putative minor capsid protein [Pseudomonas phage MR1]